MQGHLDIYRSRLFQRYKERLNARCFDLCNRALSFWESRRTPKSHFRECEWRPPTPSKWGCDINDSLLLPQTFLPPSMHQLLLIQWGNSFEFLSWNFRLRVLNFFCSSPSSLGKRMKPSRCSTGGFSNVKRIFRASQTWKLPISIFVCWKVLRHSMCRFCNRIL